MRRTRLFLRLLLLFFFVANLPAAVGPAAAPVPEDVTLPALPLRFETWGDGAFVSHGAGVTLRLEAGRLELVPPSGAARTIGMALEGSRAEGGLQGEEPLGFRTSYFRGSRSREWVRGAPSYRRVRRHDVYPGVDLLVYGVKDRLEFDFEVRAQSDPGQIRMLWTGSDRVQVDESGDLVLDIAGDELRLKAPRAYQIDGEGRTVDVSCRFRSDPAQPQRIGFDLGTFDPTRPLTIDPVVTFSSLVGWAQADAISAVGEDGEGHVYLVGWTSSLNLPTAAGAFQEEKAGGRDVFVARLAPDRSLDWITYLGGAGDDDPSNIAVDASGNVYVVGATRSSDFPTQNPFQATYSGGSDAFLFKLGPAGSTLVYSSYLGGSSDDVGLAITLGEGQEAIIAGTTRSTNLPVTAMVKQPLLAGGTDAFLSRFTADGKRFVFSTLFGGTGTDTPGDVLENPDGSILMVGTTSSSSDPESGQFPLVNALQETRSGSTDAFLVQVNADATEWDFSTYLGGRSNETGYCLARDASGRVYVGGETSSNDLAMLDPIQSVYAGGADAFILRLAPDYSAITASTYYGGAGQDSLRECRLDEFGRLVGVGVTSSPDLPLVGAFDSTLQSGDIFLAVFDLDRSLLAFSSYFGGEGTDIPGGMSLAAADRVLVAGATSSLRFPQVDPLQEGPGGSGVYRTTNAGQGWQPSGSGLDDPNVASLFVDPANGWVYAGTFNRGIYRSKDQGSTWESVGPAGQQVLSIVVDPTDSDVIYAGTSSGLRQTTNGGTDWTLLSDGQTLAFGAFSALAVDPSDHRVVYAGTSSTGIFKSSDGGETWGVRNSGLDEATGGKVILAIRVDPHDSTKVYLGTNGAVYKSANGGNTWQKTNFGAFGSVGPVYGLVIDPADSAVLYASGRVGNASIVARTDDGGDNWLAQPMQPSTGTVGSLWRSPTNDSTFFAGTFDQGVLKGTNSGESWNPTWEAVNTGLGTRQVRALAVDPDNGGRLYVGYESGSDGFVAGMQPANVFFFPQIADGTAGRIKFKTALVFVNTGEATTVDVQFFDNDGQPLAMKFGDGDAATQLEIPLEKGGASYLQSPADPGLRVGYAKITAGPGVDGTAIFNRIDTLQTPQPVVLYEAGVPATRAAGDFVFLLDSLGDNDTGLALVNASEGLSGDEDPATISLTLRDSDSFLIGESTLELARGEHVARFITELFPAVREQAGEMRGIVTVHSPVPLVALTLRQRDNPLAEFPYEVASLTPFPVMQPSNLGSVLYFPQVANGVFGLTGDNEFATSFFLANPGTLGFVTRVTLAFFDSSGAPMGLDLGTGNPVSGVTVDLAPGQFRAYQTTGSGPQQIGYARVTASSPIVAGTGVFTQRAVLAPTLRRTLYEAGVAATLPRSRFSIFVDSIGASDTGLALVNGNTEEATVTLRLYDLEFNLLSEQQITLAAGQHLPKFVYQLFPDVSSQATEMRGVLTVESTQPIAAVTLRQKAAEYSQTSVPTLTTFPVIAGVPPN